MNIQDVPFKKGAPDETTSASRPSAARCFAPKRRHLIAATLGGALEHYDFATFTFFAVFIGRTYFPSQDPFASLMLSLGTLAAGFLMRPVGGLLIGRFADRAGRKQAMLLTIIMMTLGTIGVAATPSFHTIGMAAPTIVVLARILQGLAYGGEVGAATAFVVELAPPGRRNLYLAVLQGASGFGIVVAGAIGTTVAALMSEDDFYSWGWRLPFLIGLLAVPVGLYIRKFLPETLHQQPSHETRPPMQRILPYWKPLILSTLALASMSISVYVSFYMTTYSLTALGLPISTSISVVMASGVASMVGCALGALADRLGEQMFAVVPRLLLILVSYPLFRTLTDHPGLPLLMTAAASIMILQAMCTNATLILTSTHFPSAARSTGIAVSFAVATSLFGGTTQLTAAWLNESLGDPMAVAYYLMLANVVGLFAVLGLGRQRT